VELFTEIILELRVFIEEARSGPSFHEYRSPDHSAWPPGRKGSIVMKCDTAVELGAPGLDSASFLVWTNDDSMVRDGIIAVAGPDLGEAVEGALPFGKVVLLGVSGFNEANCHERHREIERMRYGHNLDGYMMRAASQYLKEWSRVSRAAIEKKLGLANLGAAAIELYRTSEHVTSVEILFVTSTSDHVAKLRTIGGRASKLISAMNRMSEEMSFDCAACDYADICGEVDGLRALRETLRKENPHGR
jgi:CO dehydrogenase/acetyl-CoA synthase beta subunit